MLSFWRDKRISKSDLLKTKAESLLTLLFVEYLPVSTIHKKIPAVRKEILSVCAEKAPPCSGDESARNEVKILIAEMSRAVRGEHHLSRWV